MRQLTFNEIQVLEVTRHLQTQTKTIQTPLRETQCEVLDEESFVVIPILRAGLSDAGDRIFGTQ